MYDYHDKFLSVVTPQILDRIYPKVVQQSNFPATILAKITKRELIGIRIISPRHVLFVVS